MSIRTGRPSRIDKKYGAFQAKLIQVFPTSTHVRSLSITKLPVKEIISSNEVYYEIDTKGVTMVNNWWTESGNKTVLFIGFEYCTGFDYCANANETEEWK